MNRLLLLTSLLTLPACGRADKQVQAVAAEKPSELLAAQASGIPAETAAAEPAAPDQAKEQSSRLWAMRNKAQARGKARTGTYLEQMQAALSEGDFAAAETALKAAIAQGTLSEAQIKSARDSLDLAQAANARAIAAAAQAKAAAQLAANEKAAQQSATTDNESSSGGSSSSGGGGGSKPSSTELERFAARYAGGYHNFTCSKDTNPGKGNTSPWLTLRDDSTGKEWTIQYSVSQFFNRNSGSGGLTSDDRDSLRGSTLNVSFNSRGEPVSIKNPSNGNHCEVKDWQVTGYGW